MPFTKRQIDRILEPDLLPADRLPHLTTRVCETWVKRKLFVLEDQTVQGLYTLYRQAYRDLRITINDAAERYNLTTLERGQPAAMFRADVEAAAREMVRRLRVSVLREVGNAALTGYSAGYYGRAWLLDSATLPDVQISVPQLTADAMGRGAFGVSEQTGFRTPRQLLLDVLIDQFGKELDAMVGTEVDALVTDVLRVINAGMRNGDDITTFSMSIARVMGINADPSAGYKANFARVQTVARTAVLNASNQGALALYRQNADIVTANEHLTAKDERVCIQCRGLDGTLYELSDWRVPPQNTHFGCRCTIIPKLDARIMIPPDAPPVMTFGEYMSTFGAVLWLDDFMRGRKLDTRRIGDLDDIEAA